MINLLFVLRNDVQSKINVAKSAGAVEYTD